jgi:type II secretory pathway pseudopilin PulG
LHFHLPKPLHGWRAFVGEVGIIVIGVLIALGAEQVVQSIHERQEVDQLVAALRGELADDRARWEHIRASDPCTLQRLDAIERWTATAPATARLSSPFRLFLWNMHSSAWDLAKTSPAAGNIPLRDRLTYATLYGAIDNWRQFINEENANAQMLTALLETADQPGNRSQVRLHLAQARHFVGRRQLNYDYFFTRFDKLGIKPDESQLTVRPDDRRLCAPLKA